MGVGDTGDSTGWVGSLNTKVPAGRLLLDGLEENGLKATGACVGPKEKNCCAPGFGTDGRAPGLLNTNGLMGVGVTVPVGKNCGRLVCGVTECARNGLTWPLWPGNPIFALTSSNCCLRKTKGELNTELPNPLPVRN